MSHANRILIIDDDAELGQMLADFLGREGWSCELAGDGETGLEQLQANRPDAVVLDVMLPGKSGFDVLREIRAASQLPVIMLTARGEDTDRIVGLELGADDYLPKPFNPRELAARLRAILRRSQVTAVQPLQQAGLVLDARLRKLSLDGNSIQLTAAEFAVLEKLMQQAGEVIAKDDLARHALGRELMPFDRSIDTHISRLRAKLGPLPDGEPRIQSVRGRGYLLVKT
ncbi:MAG: DNA-binding response regulator [Wenzhouxiangella sp.]|nr:MAG: DNA-binding response regulator [Wenzhouxiangella sp.]